MSTGPSHSPLVYAAEMQTLVSATNREYFVQNRLYAYCYITPDFQNANILNFPTV